MTFDATTTYRPERDARSWTRWVHALENAPNGALYTLIAPRRAGKTWALRAIARQVPAARLVTLKSDRWPERLRNCVLLLDEPGPALECDPFDFVRRCADYKRAEVRVLLAATPAEWVTLAVAGGARVDEKDRRFLDPLDDEMRRKQASRAPWALDLLERLPAAWTRNPFLLEAVFQQAEDDARLRDDTDALLERTRHWCRQEQCYVRDVLHRGLSADQQAAMRRIARDPERLDGADARLLRDCHLVGPEGVADPVLADHFRPPLVVHHISDLHFGPKTADGVDAKRRGRLAEAAGQVVRDAYRRHVKARPPHAVVVSGDVVETGTPAQYTEARAWLDELAAGLAACHPDLGGEPRLLLVGGNHDVAWDAAADADPQARHRAFADAFRGWPRPELDQAPTDRPLVTVPYASVGVEFVLLGSAELGGEIEDREAREALRRIVDDLRARAAAALTADEEEEFRQLTDDANRIDPGLVHHEDLRKLDAHPWTQPVRIAVLHHPVSPMPASPEVTRYAGLLNAGPVKDALLRAEVCLVLHGHQHCGWFARETWPGRHGGRELCVAAAPTLGSRETQEAHGFNELRIYREGDDRIELEVRRFVHSAGGFAPVGEAMTVRVG